MESKYIHSPQSLSSSLTIDTRNRKPRFQRKSTGKCECKSNSKGKLSCDPMSLEKLYLKKSFFKSITHQNHQEPNYDETQVTIFDNIIDDSSKISISDHKNDCQLLQQTNNFIKCKQLSSLENQDKNKEIMKQEFDKSLKEAIFYKEKCQKQELRIRDLLSQQQKFQIELNNLRQENQKLKIQILTMKKDTSIEIKSDSLQQNTQRKPRSSINKNLSKLKQQYFNFRQQQDLTNLLFDQKLAKINKKLEQSNAQNDKLRENVARQNQLYNQKLKMMQEKSDFLQKALSFTKNSLTQLQKDYNEKQIQILESKRLNEIINEKSVQLDKLESKYNNLLKIINGDKKKITQNVKSTRNQQQRFNIPPTESKSKHAIETKNILFNQKQINLQNSLKGKEKLKNKQKFDQNSLTIKISNCQLKAKQNYRVTEMKNLPSKQDSQKGGFRKRTNSDLTFSSFNSFEFSPQI